MSSKKKKPAGTSAPRRTGRYPTAEILEHVRRFRALHAKSDLSQDRYASDNKISVGTLGRWLANHPETSQASSIRAAAESATPVADAVPDFWEEETGPANKPVRGLLSAGTDDGAGKREERAFRSTQRDAAGSNGKPLTNGHAAERIVALEEEISRERQERETLAEELAAALARNLELKAAIKNISGSL